jgi:hypothetical protein
MSEVKGLMRMRVALGALAVVAAGAAWAGCGEDDVDQAAEDVRQEAEQAGEQAQQAGEDIQEEAEQAGEDIKEEAEQLDEDVPGDDEGTTTTESDDSGNPSY